MSRFSEADHERIKRAAADTWEHVDAVQPRLVICAPALPSQDLATLAKHYHGVTRLACLTEATGDRTDAKAPQDRSEFTREAFGSFL